MKDSKPVESFETSNKEFRITQKEFVLMEETNYSVKVRSIRKNDDGDKFSEYSQAANFFVKKEIEQVKYSRNCISPVGKYSSKNKQLGKFSVGKSVV